MAKDKVSDNYRDAARYSQVYNHATGHYIKRDIKSRRFLEIESDGKQFKGIVVEPTYILANPGIKKSSAVKAELAVIKVRNAKAS